MSADSTTNDRPAEFALDESAEDFYEMAPCGYLTTTIDGRIVKVNRTLTEWLGFERRELTDGKRFVDLLTVGGKIFFETHLLLRMQSAVEEIALDIVCKNGRVLPALINARQKRNAADEPVLNRFTIFNASERRRYERDLLAARDVLRTTLASIGDGVIATRADGRVTFMNPVAEELSGWKNDEARGLPIDQVLVLVHENNRMQVENPITHALRDGAAAGLSKNAVLVSRDGRRIPIDDSASPIRNDDGDVAGGVLVFRDISERKKVENALRAAHEQLEMSAAELRRSNEDLSEFAYVASHDLKSPLNTVMQFAELLERNYGSRLGDGKALLDYLTTAAKRMSKLIEDLLLFASCSGKSGHVVSPVDANLQLRTAIDNLQSVIAESGATITQDVLPTVPVDGSGLVQIFKT